MASGFSMKFNDGGIPAILDQLAGPVATSLARSMGVAGGQVLRDEAKQRAPVDDGTLRDSIYLAYREGKSTESRVMYSVTWNSRKAPHGHLLEFGYWQQFKVVKIGEVWVTTKERLAQPKWTPAWPFLRPAIEAAGERAIKAMIQRGRERLPELLRDLYTLRDDEFV